MKEQMIKMLVDKHMSETNTEQLLRDKRKNLFDYFKTEDVFKCFQEEFPGCCEPKMFEAMENLNTISWDIMRKRYSKGRLPQHTFHGWAVVIDQVIELLRESAIELPNN
jgi:hypothetical protein